jgi:hypothetical protein
MPGTGAAGIMPTDARAAVRNSACPVMRTKPLINPYPAGQRRFTVALPLFDVGATEASCAVQLHPLFLLFAFMQAVQDSRAPWYQRGLIRKPLPEIGVILLHDVERCFVGEIAMVLGK